MLSSPLRDGGDTWGSLAFGESDVATDALVAQSGSVSVETIRSPNVAVSGVEAQSHFGGVMVEPDTVLFPGGVQAVGSVGEVSLSIGVDQAVTGVTASGESGAVSVVIQVDFTVGSVQAAGEVAGVEVAEGTGVLVQGVSAVASTAQVLVWSAIDPDQDSGVRRYNTQPNRRIFGSISAQSPSYADITPGPSGSWVEIVPEAA